MGFSGDVNSKYALENFRVPNTGDKKMKRLAIGGGVVLAAWVVGIGAFAISRFQKAQPELAASGAAVMAAAQARVAPAPAPIVPVAAVAAVQAPPAALPVVAKTSDNASSRSHKASKSKSRSHASSKRHSARRSSYAATTPTSKASSGGQARMKDDQLDALLKQFK